MFTVLDRISWPGYSDRPNEDACGVAGDWAWVIDTSIFPGTPSCMHPQSDAAWFAGFVDDRFAALAGDAEDGRELVRRVMQEAREAFLASAPADRQDFMTWPMGALTLVRVRDARLDVWSFADTTAFLRWPDAPVLVLGEAPGLRDEEVASAARLLAATGSTPKDITQTRDFREWLAGLREIQRSGGGLPILGLRPETADRLRHERVDAPAGTTILLTSDGFSALVDLYRAYDASGLMAEALARGLEPLAMEARRIETEDDPDGRRFPRFKVSDDATALLLRCE